MTAFSVEILTPPAAEPLTLAEVKAHCRVEHSAEDPAFADWIAAARAQSERFTDRFWVARTVTLTLPGFPAGAIQLPVRPVTAVSAVRYWPSGTPTEAVAMAGADWQTWLAHNPPLLLPAPGTVWPATWAGKAAAVEVDLAVGYADPSAVPPDAKAAMKLAVGYWYEHRGDTKDPNATAESLGLPPAAVRLLTELRGRAYR